MSAKQKKKFQVENDNNAHKVTEAQLEMGMLQTSPDLFFLYTFVKYSKKIRYIESRKSE